MADVSSSITSWSTTAASNAPTGATTIGTGLDDNLREVQAVVRAEYDKTVPALVPSGRLTLTTAVPVTTSDVTGATTVYYTPFASDTIVLYDGTNWAQHTFTELSQDTTDNTKSPAAVANNSNYDMFVWNDSGTLRCTRGPAWTSDTGRGTGAATTELELFEGRYVNKIAITNGPAARRGLYVGTIRSDGSAQINDSLAKRHVWNNYNRRQRPMRVLETTDNWTYTTATIRQVNGSTANQLDFVLGLNEDCVKAHARSALTNNTAGPVIVAVGIGLDSTTAFATGCISGFHQTPAQNVLENTVAEWIGFPGLGRHYLAWLEYSSASGTSTWYGDNGATGRDQLGIHGELLS